MGFAPSSSLSPPPSGLFVRLTQEAQQSKFHRIETSASLAPGLRPRLFLGLERCRAQPAGAWLRGTEEVLDVAAPGDAQEAVLGPEDGRHEGRAEAADQDPEGRKPGAEKAHGEAAQARGTDSPALRQSQSRGEGGQGEGIWRVLSINMFTLCHRYKAISVKAW